MSLALAAVLTAGARGQTVEHYWTFDTPADIVGNVPTTAVGTPDLSIHPTYGEAHMGSGASLNTVIGGLSNGSGYLQAAVLSSALVHQDYGTESFSFSYWVWDDFAADGDVNGPRVFDNLNGTMVGIQLATNTPGYWNLRVDDDTGAASIYDQVAMYTPPTDRWVHIVGVVDRGVGQVRLYVNGALASSGPLTAGPGGAPLTGNVAPTQDLQIGAINGGALPGQAQTQGLDELAFYRGVLTEADARNLVAGILTPLDFRRIGTNYCGPAVPNTTGASGQLRVTGSLTAAANDLRLHADGLPHFSFGFFLTSRTQGVIQQPGGSQGVLCLGGAIGRYVGPGQIKNAGTFGGILLDLDLTSHPTPSGSVTVVAGDTWNFTAWYRDVFGGAPTSNFTDAVSVTFQ